MLAIRTGLLQRAGGLFSILAQALEGGSFIQSPLLKQTASTLRRAVGSRDSWRTMRIKRGGDSRVPHSGSPQGPPHRRDLRTALRWRRNGARCNSPIVIEHSTVITLTFNTEVYLPIVIADH